MSWQPIETAPKDGSHIIGWSALAKDMAMVQCVGGRWRFYPDGQNLIPNELTLWQPLPAPPASERDMEAGR